MNYHIAPVEVGNQIATSAMGQARREVNHSRINGVGVDSFVRGYVMGQLLCAECDCEYDPLLMLAVKNEVRFLLYSYGCETPQEVQ